MMSSVISGQLSSKMQTSSIKLEQLNHVIDSESISTSDDDVGKEAQKLLSDEEITLVDNYLAVVYQCLLSKKFLAKTSDIQLRFDDLEFFTHRFMLIHHSPFLGQLALKARRDTAVFLNAFVSAHVYEMINNWIYCQPVRLSDKEEKNYLTLKQLKKAAKRLQVQGLCDEIKHARNDALSIKTAPSIFTYSSSASSFLNKYDSLCVAAYCLMRDNLAAILSAKDFVMLPPQSIIKLLSDDDLLIDGEWTVLDAALRWLAHDSDERDKFAIHLIPQVRFEYLSVSDLIRVMDMIIGLGETQEIFDKTQCRFLQHVSCINQILSVANKKLMALDNKNIKREDLGSRIKQVLDAYSIKSKLPDHQLFRPMRRSKGLESDSSMILMQGESETEVHRYRNCSDLGILQGLWEAVYTMLELNRWENMAIRRRKLFESLRQPDFQNLTCEVKIICKKQVFLIHRFLLTIFTNQLAKDSLAGTFRHKACMFVDIPKKVFTIIYNWLYANHIDLGPCYNDERRKEFLEEVNHHATQIGFEGLSNWCYLYKEQKNFLLEEVLIGEQ